MFRNSLARNWTQTAEIGDAVEKGEIVEIVNIHTVFMHFVENMVGCRKRLDEYPTLSRPHSPFCLEKQSRSLCTDYARIQHFHGIGDCFEREADSPICWKR
jgi:hypothetical protein